VNATNAHKSLVELKGGGTGNAPGANKQPVMNPFSACPTSTQPQYQQGVYGQQQGGGFNQQPYNNYTV